MPSVEKLLTRIENRFDHSIVAKITHGELTLEVQAADLVAFCQCLRDEPDFKFEQLMDICGVDYLHYGASEWSTDKSTREGFSRGVKKISSSDPSKYPARFAVVYHLLSVTRNQRLRLRVFAHGEAPSMPSVVNIWQSANWYEREAFDLFGINFTGHPDLRRILTDYEFNGHPFRKDFPLIGEVEMRYDAKQSKVIYEPVSIEARTLVPKVIRQVGVAHPCDPLREPHKSRET